MGYLMTVKVDIDYFNNKEAEFNKQGVFSQSCPTCDQHYTILSQKDDEPEYYTIIFTYCECGELLKWSLPVN